MEVKVLLADLAERFNCVVVDTPPVLEATDPAIPSWLLGGTMLVAVMGVAEKPAITAASEALGGFKNRVTWIMLTRMAFRCPDTVEYDRHGNMQQGNDCLQHAIIGRLFIVVRTA